MLFGHNTNVTVGSTTYHVQTEDRGVAHALIDTTVYYHGRVLHRRTNNYYDLLPLDPDREQALGLRLDEQHHNVVEEIRSGSLQLAIPFVPVDEKTLAPRSLTLELLNPKTWLSGKHATLQIAVRDASNQVVGQAKVTLSVDGAAHAAEYSAETSLSGQAHLEFDMPRITGAEPALVLHATHGTAKGHLRFALRAKPRVPSA